jgi:type IV pilus assembly protein PilA
MLNPGLPAPEALRVIKAAPGQGAPAARQGLRARQRASSTRTSSVLEDTDMLARIRKAQEENESGFTLIELLVVMIIIGILAAIAIPVFLSQRAKAQDSAAKADVSTVGKEIASYYVDGATPPAIAISADRQYTINTVPVGRASNNVALAWVPATTATAINWCVSVTNPQGSVQNWRYSASNGLEQGLCTPALGGVAVGA